MANRHNSNLSLFLMELIVVIFFFSLSSAVCVRLFSGAHTLSDRSSNLSEAVTWSQNVTEVFCNSSGDLKKISDIFPEAYVSYESEEGSRDGVFMIFFDNNWQIMQGDQANASYELVMDICTKDAASVYSDISDYNVEYKGLASVAKIAVCDLRGGDDILSSYPEEERATIMRNTVDVYIGEEADQ